MAAGTKAAAGDGNATRAIDAIFFDIRDTLGVVDRKGHLVKYKPTTDQLLEAMKQVVGLRIGLITNLPANVSAAEGKKMVEEAGITDFLDPKGFVTNHEAGAQKPNPQIYAAAAAQMGVPVERCLFVGENLIEVIGAQTAGMHATVKPYPPGREFLLKPIKPAPPSETNSGRLSEIMMEEDHLVGKRIVGCGIKIRDKLNAILSGASPKRRSARVSEVEVGRSRIGIRSAFLLSSPLRWCGYAFGTCPRFRSRRRRMRAGRGRPCGLLDGPFRTVRSACR